MDFLPDNISLNENLSATSVDENCQRNSRWSPEIGELVERGSHSAACVEYIIYDHDIATIDSPRDIRRTHDWPWTDGLQVVPIECDVERTKKDSGALTFLDEPAGRARQRNAAPLDSY